MVEIDQLVEGVEFLLPQEVFPRGLSQHLEVLDLVPVAGGKDPQLPQTAPSSQGSFSAQPGPGPSLLTTV